MDSAARALVWQRAGSCCEYCRLAQSDTPFRTFHVDHILPRKHGGSDDPDNLALACDRCSLHKGPNLAGDDETQAIVQLFHPRVQRWEDHFRATVRVCGMNSPRRLRLRVTLQTRH